MTQLNLNRFLILVFSCLTFLAVQGQALSGTYTIPGNVNSIPVSSLTQLSGILNAGTVSGTAIFEFDSAYNTNRDTFPITFTQFGGGGKVIIRPAASVTKPLLTAGYPFNIALINLSGVTNLSFDGRPGGIGSRIQWVFQCPAIGSPYPAFQFMNGASADTLQYLAIQSSTPNTSATIFFDTSNVSGGNSNNVIQYDSIGNYSYALTYNAILSNGTAGANANSGNTISNNNIYNFQGYDNGPVNGLIVPVTDGGVVITQNGNGGNWNISNNSFYSTDTTPQSSSFISAIYFGPGKGSSGNVISGNYIGGKGPVGGTAGSPWIYNGYRGYTSFTDFTGIYVYDDTGSVTTVSNNTVQNIRLLSQYGSATFAGIHVGNGLVNVTGNTIGHPDVPASVNVGSCGEMVGIWNESSSRVTIDHNVIANLLSDFSDQPIVETPSGLVGIYCYVDYDKSWSLGPNIITNNQVYSIRITNNYNSNQYFPVNDGGGGMGVYETIENMHLLAGICVQSVGNGAQQIISKNTLYNLSDTLPPAHNGGPIYVDGIVASAGNIATTTINGNLIYGLWTNNSYGDSVLGQERSFTGINGILLPGAYAGKYFVTNNMIQLGTKPTDGSSVINSLVTGIWDNNAGINSNVLKYYIYHNSVYIGGTDNNSHGYNLNSYAFRRDLSFISSAYDSLNIKNNIFGNNRSSSSGTGINYGIFLNDTTDVSSDYNLVYGTGSNYNFGSTEGASFASSVLYQQANSGYEVNTLTTDPQFVSANTTIPDLHVQSGSPVDMAGTAANTIVYDFDSLVRANYSPVDIGAAVVGGCTPVPPTISIMPSSTFICPGNVVRFTTSVTNGGTAPVYNFFVDGVSQQNGASGSFYTNSLNNGDSVWVEVTSNATCVSPDTAVSSTVYISVGTTVVNISDSICPGETYYFFNGDTIASTGVYYDTIPSLTSCDTIVVLSLFAAAQPIIAQLGSDTLTVTSSNYQSYQWLLNDTALLSANVQFYVTNVSGLYRVVVISSSLCTDTSVIYVYYASGEDNISGRTQVNLYPNPANDKVHLNVEGLDPGPVTIRLTDVYGEQVLPYHREPATPHYNTTLDVSELPSGIYLLSIQSGQSTYNRKVELVR